MRFPFSLFFFLLFTFKVLGQEQEENPLEVNFIPPPPEAASLGKYIDMPVSYYSGLPSISIPIFHLKSHELELPISLSYHPSGIKAEEISSWVGAGWALNAGGVISRTLKGLEDEGLYGYLNNYQVGDLDNTKFFNANGELNVSYLYENVQLKIPSNNGETGGACKNNNSENYVIPDPDYVNIHFAARGGFDFEPDQFFYSIPGAEGAKFYFNRAGEITQIPIKPNTITYENYSNGVRFESWEIKGLDGVRYIFADKDTTFSVSNCESNTPQVVVEESGHYDIPLKNPFVASWKLSKMISANSLDTIYFEYVNDEIVYKSSFTYSQYNRYSASYINNESSGSPSSMPSLCYSINYSIEKRLSRIRTSSGYEVEFIPRAFPYTNSEGTVEGNRKDLNGGSVLERIDVYFKGVPIKSVILDHYYYGNTLTEGKCLLMLKSVTECDGTQNCNPPTRFEYFAGESYLDRQSFNIDHWGYYNGTSNLMGVVPSVIIDNKVLRGANRESNLEYARTATLKRIEYPTGGVTDFQFELNDFSNLPQNYLDTYAVHFENVAAMEFAITADPYANYNWQGNFTLTQPTEVIFKFQLPDIGGGLSEDCKGVLTNTATGYTKYIYGLSDFDPELETLPAGSYTFSANFNPMSFSWGPGNPLEDQEFSIEIVKVSRLEDLVQNNKLKGGGLRIKNIVKKSETGEILLRRNFDYTMDENGQSISSGILLSHPSYATIKYSNDGKMGGYMNLICFIGDSEEGYLRTSNSNIPLGVNQGVHVGYSRVTEFENNSSGTLGYKVFEFTNMPDSIFAENMPTLSYGYKNGLLLNERVYSNIGLQEETINTYEFSNLKKVGASFRIREVTNNACTFCINRYYDYGQYHSITERVALKSTQKNIYDLSGAIRSHTSAFTYTEFDQIETLRENFFTNEEEEFPKVKVSEFSYLAAVPTMLQEKVSYWETANDQVIFESGLMYSYGPHIKPSEVRILEPSPEPAPLAGVKGNSTQYKKRLGYTLYSAKGKPLEYHLEDNVPISLLWDTDAIFPISQVQKAQNAEVAFTSFENGPDEGNWLYSTSFETSAISKTGNKSLKISSTSVSTNGLAEDKTYILSFYSRDGAVQVSHGVSVLEEPTTDGWVYHTYIVENTTTLQLSGNGDTLLDELRLYPSGAQMTTYTYKPGVGVSSMTDPNNRTTYYEYDSFNRLVRAKNDAGEILQTYEYKYHNQD